MILHPDGKIEGTPEEIVSYQKQLNDKFSKEKVVVNPLPWQSSPWKTPGISTTKEGYMLFCEKEMN